MALKMVKKVIPEVEISPVIEPVVLPKVAPYQQTGIEALTAEYIELYRKYVYFEVKDMVRRMDDIRKQLQTVANETQEDFQIAVFKSTEGEVEFSERTKVAKVADPLALINELLTKFGPEPTMSVVNIAITPLRKMLSEFELKQHLIDQPGSRILKSVRPT